MPGMRQSKAAPGNASVTIDVIDQVTPRLQALPPKIQRSVMRKTLRSVAMKVSRRLAAGTPVDRSKYARGVVASKSVRVYTVRSTNDEAYAVVKYKGPAAGYMTVYEYGSNSQEHRQIARPYFKRAISGWEAEAKSAFAESLAAAVEDASFVEAAALAGG